MKKFSLIIILLFLCAFNKNDYKVEKIVNNGSEFFILIPKNFCFFDSQANNKFILEYIEKNNRDYVYFNCSEVEKINSNKDFNVDEYITISIPRESDLLFFNKDFIVNNGNAYKNTDFKEKLLKINLDDFAKKEKISNAEKKFIKENIEESIDFISDNTKVDHKTIDNDQLVVYNFKTKNHEIFISNYYYYLKGSLFSIDYESKNRKRELNNLDNFSEYVKEVQKLNKGRINNYYIFQNQILNIISPNNQKFEDVSDVNELNRYKFEKIFIENIDILKEPKILIAVKLFPENFKVEDFMKLITQDSATECKDGKYNCMKIQTKNNIHYFYFVKIKNYNLLIRSFIHYKPSNFNDKKIDSYLKKRTKNYIKKLEKANK